MADMLVRLYDLPAKEGLLEKLQGDGIIVRNVRPYEKGPVVAWVKQVFGEGWGNECEVAFCHLPATCFVATDGKQLIGFACYECTCRNYFGPTGVHPDYRGRGVGKALLISSLHAMNAYGYAYAIIGGVGDAPDGQERLRQFYANAVGAELIAGSAPGIYFNRL